MLEKSAKPQVMAHNATLQEVEVMMPSLIVNMKWAPTRCHTPRET